MAIKTVESAKVTGQRRGSALVKLLQEKAKGRAIPKVAALTFLRGYRKDGSDVLATRREDKQSTTTAQLCGAIDKIFAGENLAETLTALPGMSLNNVHFWTFRFFLEGLGFPLPAGSSAQKIGIAVDDDELDLLFGEEIEPS